MPALRFQKYPTPQHYQRELEDLRTQKNRNAFLEMQNQYAPKKFEHGLWQMGAEKKEFEQAQEDRKQNKERSGKLHELKTKSMQLENADRILGQLQEAFQYSDSPQNFIQAAEAFKSEYPELSPHIDARMPRDPNGDGVISQKEWDAYKQRQLRGLQSGRQIIGTEFERLVNELQKSGSLTSEEANQYKSMRARNLAGVATDGKTSSEKRDYTERNLLARRKQYTDEKSAFEENRRGDSEEKFPAFNEWQQQAFGNVLSLEKEKETKTTNEDKNKESPFKGYENTTKDKIPALLETYNNDFSPQEQQEFLAYLSDQGEKGLRVLDLLEKEMEKRNPIPTTETEDRGGNQWFQQFMNKGQNAPVQRKTSNPFELMNRSRRTY